MSIYCLVHGQVEESNWDRVKRNERIVFYHLSAEGEIRQEPEAVNIADFIRNWKSEWRNPVSARMRRRKFM